MEKDRKIEDNRVGDEKSLIARNNKKYWKKYRQIWYMLNNENWTEAPVGKLMANKVSVRVVNNGLYFIFIFYFILF